MSPNWKPSSIFAMFVVLISLFLTIILAKEINLFSDRTGVRQEVASATDTTLPNSSGSQSGYPLQPQYSFPDYP